MMKRLLAVFVLATAVSTVAGCKCVSADYLDADEETRTNVDPIFRAYVKADSALDEEQKARRIRLLDSWRIRVEKAKEALK